MGWIGDAVLGSATTKRRREASVSAADTPNLPTKITTAKICWLKISGKFSVGLGIPPLKIKIMLE